MRTRINITNILVAFVSCATMGACSSEQPKNPKEKYESIVFEISKEPTVFEDTREASENDETLVKAALKEALQDNDFFYAKKYCILLRSINYSEAERYNEKIKNAEASIIKNSIEEALKKYDFDSANKYCTDLEVVKYTEAEDYRNKIKLAETTYFISQNSENAANHLISLINTRPSKKPSIGRESESAPAYDWQSKRHNKYMDEYLDKALKNENDILAQKILAEYVEELTYETIKKKYDNGVEYKVNVVTGFTDKHKKDAIKRYEEAKISWKVQ